jgi:hypothetical protein
LRLLDFFTGTNIMYIFNSTCYTSKTLLSAFTITLMAALTGCASIVNGVNQSVSVNTSSVTGAICALKNDKGTWFVNSTPGSVTVHRSYSALDIRCEKAGYEAGYAKIDSKVKAMFFGNILFGGLIGVGVDVAGGAAYDYPTTITIPMRPKAS